MRGMAKPSPTHAGAPALLAIGAVIRAMRAEKGISQEGLANAIGLDRSYMGGIERGEHNLTVMNLMRISAQLEVDASELFKRADL